MKRVLTAAIGIPLALAAIFLLPGPGFFLVVLAVIELAVLEYVRVARHWSPSAPLLSLLGLVPLAAWVLVDGLGIWISPASMPHVLSVSALVLSVGLASLVLLTRTSVEEGLPGIGSLAFGVVYFSLPAASLTHLQILDPWLLLLMLAIVWLGDTAAYYVGSAVGKHKMAPRVSPNKSWEGAAASLAAAMLVALVWSLWRQGAVDPWLLGLAALTSVAAQIGDLVESMLKRGAGVKDSGTLLPGHGGVLDRIDALLFAAPVFDLGLILLVHQGLLR